MKISMPSGSPSSNLGSRLDDFDQNSTEDLENGVHYSQTLLRTIEVESLGAIIRKRKSLQAEGHRSESSESVGPSSVTESNGATGAPTRRLIKADFSLLDSLDDDLDDDDDDFDIPTGGSISPVFEDSSYHLKSTPTSTPTSPWHHSKDLTSQGSRSTGSSPSHTNLSRRHTIAITSPKQEDGPFGHHRNRHGSFRGGRKGVLANGSVDDGVLNAAPTNCSHSSLQEEFFRSNQWQQAVECLSLTLEEVVHIRNVLTKADLESLPVDCSLKEDVEKSKVCFLCLKTRFSIFGPWGHKCRMCRRTVCNKCCSKMRIPTDHFSQIPVFTLSPTLSPREEDQQSFARTILSKLNLPESHSSNTVGSAPSSPSMGSQRSEGNVSNAGVTPSSVGGDEETGESPHSLPSLSSVSMGILRMKK